MPDKRKDKAFFLTFRGFRHFRDPGWNSLSVTHGKLSLGSGGIWGWHRSFKIGHYGDGSSGA